MFSHLELNSDLPIKSGRELGRDKPYLDFLCAISGLFMYQQDINHIWIFCVPVGHQSYLDFLFTSRTSTISEFFVC